MSAVIMALVRGNTRFALKIAVILFLASHDKLGPLRGVLSGSDHDIWPFDDLKMDMDAKGNAKNTWSPVGKGLYLDGTHDTYVKLKKHDKSCLEHPSDCDITIGLFLKIWPSSGLEIYFGNKDADDELYEGINIYYDNGKLHVEVYGKNKYCARVIFPPERVWFYLGLVWEKNGNLAVYQDRWYSQSSWEHKQCGKSPSGLKKRGDYYLGRNTFPVAFYKDLNIWSSKQSRNVLDERWDSAFHITGSTEIGLKINFPDLVYNSGDVAKWSGDFSDQVNDLYNESSSFEQIKDVSVADRNGHVSVSSTLKFSQISWRNVLNLQLALENGTLLGSPGVIDEAACQSGNHDFICKVPKNAFAFTITSTSVKMEMDTVSVPLHESYLYGYRILYKNLEDQGSEWTQRAAIRCNVDPILGDVSGLIPYTNYSFRVFAESFQSVGLISEPIKVRTLESVPDIGPEIIAYYNTSSSSIYVEWEHSIPRRNVRGILVGYRVAWDEDYFSSDHVNDSEGYSDVALDTSNYIVTSLHEYWRYNIHVAGRTSVGHGTYSTVTVETGEDVPSAPPSHVHLHMTNESALNVNWHDVPFIHQNGVILGYRLLLQQDDSGPVVWNVTVGRDVHWYMFTNLETFQTYSTQILAFTIKGEGPLSSKVNQKTDGSVPINSPVNLTAHNVSSREIEVSWDYDEDPRLVRGDLQGFLLYFSEANASDFFPEDAIATPHYRGTSRSTRVGGLEIFRLYNISVAARTAKGPGPTNESVVVRTHGEVPGASPQAFTAYNTSSSSISASWKEIVADKQHGIMQGYKLFFYEVTTEGGLKSLENHTYDLAVHEETFTGLKKYTKYRAEVQGFNNYGDGPVGAVEVFTEEGIPTQHPRNFTAFNRSSTIIRATWRSVPQCCQLGFIQGYHVTLTDPSNSSATITNTVAELFTRFINLKKFHMYQLSITAFTSKGSGPSASTTASTDQDVPEAPPQNVSGYNMSQTEIHLFWAPVPADKVNGIVTGYKVSYRKAQGHQPVQYKSFNSSSFQAVMDGLSPFTVYNIDVRAFTIRGDGTPSPFITVQTEEEAPQVAPGTFQGFNSSSTSIVLSWDPIPVGQVAGILRNFHITYRPLDTADNTTYNISLPITNLTLEITNLQKYTNYSFEIKGVTKFIGAPTEPIIVTTGEDVPSLPPQDIKIQNSSSTSISVRWKPIPKDHVNGILLGMKLLYRSAPRDNSIVFRSRARRSTEERWSEYTNITLPPGALSYEMTSLKKFTNYSVVILGFTSKGDGNVSQQFVASTDEDVPSMPPTNFMPISRSGDFKMSVTWDPVPDGFVHGILLGYHVYYTKIQQTGRPVTTLIDKKIFGPYDYNTTILLLDNFAIYNLEIAAFTIKGDGARSQIKDGSTCNCPRVFKTTWYPFPPYVTYEDGVVGGFIPRILEDAVEYCCSDCLLPNGRSASAINFELDGRGNLAPKSGVEELISSIDSLTDFSVPVNGYQGQTHYSIYRYVKLAESPGVAFITVMDPSEKTFAIANVFIQSWPLLVLTFIMMLAAGMAMWMMEAQANRTEFPRSFFQGASEGVWWAFVTSTTVGYGDRCPRWVLSRMFAIAWTVCGLVVIAILTGKIATALTDFGYTGPYIPLYGAEVAAIANNSDFRLGVRKNARVNTVRNYRTYEEISQALKDQEVKGALVDLYVLSSHKHLFDDPRFRIVRVYDYKASYGVVLAGHSMKLEDCFTEHIKAHTASVFQKIEENVKILKEPDESPAEQQSTSLFAVSSPQFITAVIIIASLLLLACVLGIIYESRRRKTNKVLKQSKDLKNEMSPLVDSFLVSIKKKVEALSKRHRQDRCHVMRLEKERDQQAGYAVNKYYQVLSMRDIRQQWSHRPLSVINVASSLNGKNSYNPTLWPFTEAAKPLSPNVTQSWKHGSLPSGRKQGFDLPAAPVTLEPNVRVIDETSL